MRDVKLPTHPFIFDLVLNLFQTFFSSFFLFRLNWFGRRFFATHLNQTLMTRRALGERDLRLKGGRMRVKGIRWPGVET